jgi:hypothetical protein
MRLIVCLITSILTLTPAVAVHAAVLDISTRERVVAFADVHGAYDDWVALLKELGIVDDQLNWSGGRTHLVSVGDLIDRGPGSRDVVELLMKLDAQAEQAGGAVHMTLGNHEVMVMTGDLRYVSPQEFAAFADDETEAERNALFAEYRRFNPDGDENVARARFDEQFPSGFIGLRKAYSLDGHLGSWLARQPFVIKVNDKVYMHGGIARDAADDSLESLNERLQGEFIGFLEAMQVLQEAGQMPLYVSYHDRLGFLNARAEEFVAANPDTRPPWFEQVKLVFDAQEALVFDAKSPVWYRGTASCHPLSESFNTESFLKRVGAKQLVMGHTPTRGDVQQRMDGLALRLDTGMLRSVYKGRASALVSNDGSDYVHYLGEAGKAQPTPERTSLAMKLSGMSDAGLEDFMRTAPVTNVEEIGTGITNPWRVTQERDGVVNDAVFKYEDTKPDMQNSKSYISRRFEDSDRYHYDVAAYKLDRMLGWEMVPTAVLAEVNGREGALSDWVTGAINERDRLEQEMPFESYCDQWEQYRLRFVFDILIHNVDRNLTNILWTKDDFMMKFIDHSLAFRTSKKRPKQYRKVDLEVSDLLASRLQQLNQDNLSEELRPYLHPRQIEAILDRRDLILKEAIRTGR